MNWQPRRARIEFAPRTVQNIPDWVAPAFLFSLLVRVQFAGHIPKMLAGVKEVDDLDGTGKVIAGNIPNPCRSIADHDFLFRARPAAIPGFQIDSFAELARRLDGGDISRGARIAGRPVHLSRSSPASAGHGPL